MEKLERKGRRRGEEERRIREKEGGGPPEMSSGVCWRLREGCSSGHEKDGPEKSPQTGLNIHVRTQQKLGRLLQGGSAVGAPCGRQAGSGPRFHSCPELPLSWCYRTHTPLFPALLGRSTTGRREQRDREGGAGSTWPPQ